VGSVLLATFVIPGFPIFLPTLIAIGIGTFLWAPLELLKHGGGDFLFEALFHATTRPRDEGASATAFFDPRGKEVGWSRPFVLMAAAAGSEPESKLVHFIPVAGPLLQAGDEAAMTKARMRSVGQSLLGDSPDRDLAAMDTTADALAFSKGAIAAVGEGVVLGGVGVGAYGAMAPAAKWTDQKTGDAIGLAGLGVALAGLGIYALAESVDTVKIFAVPAAYGAFQ
jgi:hypothetical protein